MSHPKYRQTFDGPGSNVHDLVFVAGKLAVGDRRSIELARQRVRELMFLVAECPMCSHVVRRHTMNECNTVGCKCKLTRADFHEGQDDGENYSRDEWVDP